MRGLLSVQLDVMFTTTASERPEDWRKAVQRINDTCAILDTWYDSVSFTNPNLFSV